MRIIKYNNCSDIDVMFLDEYCYVVHKAAYVNFRNGCIKNPYDKVTYNVGYTGCGKYMTSINGVATDAYNTWHNLLRRCYSDSAKDKFPAYYGICTVCKQWHNFQNFAEWFENNKYDVNERLHIDKDILYPGNKIYCSDTCILVPQSINMLFMNKPNKRGLPNGISLTQTGKYDVKYCKKKLGRYNSLEDAFLVYAKEKKNAIVKIAEEYKNIIPIRVYNALIDYDLRIDIDKNYVA